jgi:ABC-2 type transport system permease protein
MIGVFLTKLRLFAKKPWTFVIMSFVCLLLAYFTSQGNMGKITIPYTVEDKSAIVKEVTEKMKESDSFHFKETSLMEMESAISEGKQEVGIVLKENDFDMIVTSKTANSSVVQQLIGKVYQDVKQEESLIATAGKAGFTADEVKGWINKSKESPVFTVESESFKGKDSFIYDQKLQALFGFALFFVIYTIAYGVLDILLEKKSGVWDRMILSPLKKWQMYMGNLLFSFLLGYIQIVLIFIVFRYITDVDFYGNFPFVLLLLLPYVFAIVAMSMMITGLVKTVQQFNAVIPLVAVSMAMIGGAYWPLEIVSSNILLFISKFVPITYGMELLKGATVYNWSMAELLFPASVLVMMGVLMMGIGINFMEKRHV